MPTFEDPAADAAEARNALRGLAHATQTISDPRQIYVLLGDLSTAATALSQALHQIASAHDATQPKTAWVPDDSRTARAAVHQVSWDLHRAGEILHHVAASIDDAHQAEGTVTYQRRETGMLADTPRSTPSPELGLGL